jgi:uncharacterized protein YndB with AHSA1/START domain
MTTTRSLVIERELPHPLEKVWRALTQGPLIQEWLMANDFQLLVGHKFKFRSTPMPNWNGVIDCEVLAAAAHGAIRFPSRSRGRLSGRQLWLAEVHRQSGTSGRGIALMP